MVPKESFKLALANVRFAFVDLLAKLCMFQFSSLQSRPMLILASASPRRHELLRNAGIPFVVRVADIPEIPRANELPDVFVKRMAREKARAIARSFPNDLVLGADTIVIIDEQILGKPRDQADAARMLRLLSGKTHRVTTAVCLSGPQTADRPENEEVQSETTLVTMNEISGQEIQDYIATGEPMDKAGAYAIQGRASRWVRKIEGDYFNVVGLPVALVYRMLRERGELR